MSLPLFEEGVIPVQKLINPNKRRKEPNFFLIISVLTLTLLAISPVAVSASKLELSSPPEVGHVLGNISLEVLENAGNSVVASNPQESFGPSQEIELYTDLVYVGAGFGALILILLIYLYMTSRSSQSSKKPLKCSDSLKIWPTLDKTNRENSRMRKLRIFTGIPILCIIVAELLIFSGRIGVAVWVHIGILITLSLSNMLIKDREIHKIHQALMLLPVLRLINLSMPVFFETTLYTFIFIYGPLAIPVGVMVIHQRNSLEQIGISMKNIVAYMILSIPIGFLLGLGEYMTIKTGSLIPDLTFGNLLKLTIVMVFFVGLIEELIFRSILQTTLEEALNVQEALLITSIMFGLMHSGYGTFYEILYTGFVGFIMGLAFYKTRSLPFIAVLHGFVNVFLFGILPHYFGG